ncbi:MAG: molybdopterin biosynthesis protein [Planctomycetota bacterium]
MKQEQFLDVVTQEEAERRFRAAVDFAPLEPERVALESALDRVLAADVVSPLDVPGFARADRDGFALRASETFGASEEDPATLRLSGEVLPTGVRPAVEVTSGTATPIATGAVLPRGADAVVMVEDTDVEGDVLVVRRAVSPGAWVSQAGADVASGETVLRAGDRLSSRETGTLAALGIGSVDVVRRPMVAVFSTGDEIVAPGKPLFPGAIHDANARILADAVREAGGEPIEGGILKDDEELLGAALGAAVQHADMVLFSGGTSKGAGDVSYRVVAARGELVVHGVALKPGKPVALGKVGDTPVVILPGFPTSAVFTFHTFVAPWIRARAGWPPHAARTVRARLWRAVTTGRGRAEYDLVHLVDGRAGLTAYPLGKGSGSITTFARADGFYLTPAGVERREAGEEVDVTLITGRRPSDLTVIGSHCTGLDLLLTKLRRKGFTSRVITVGSTAGLEAAKRGECDIAGVHLLDAATGLYNEPFVVDGIALHRGYGRRQGVVGDDTGRMVNRNRGSGTRILIDGMLEGRRPDGYDMEVRSHQAVAAAVRSGRADWGVCIENVADGLDFRFLAEERFDFLVPGDRRQRPAVRAFLELLDDPATRSELSEIGFVA